MDRSIRKRRKDFERNKRRMGVQRSGRRRMDVLSGREKWISTIAGFQVFFLAWNLGSMHAWAQWVNLGLALLGFLGLLIPDATALPRQGLQGMARLFGSPVFWFGGLFLAYVGVQCTNHSWMYEVVIPDASIQEVAGEESTTEGTAATPPAKDGKIWHILPNQNHKKFLPASVDAPFEKMNARRVVLMFAPIWIWGCILSLGLERRRGLRRVLWAAVIGGATMAMLGLMQRLTGAKEIFWMIESNNPAFFGSFIYPNHGAAFLYLLLAVAIGLGLYHQQQSEQEFLRSGPHYLLAFLGILIFLGLVFSQSRAGLVLGGGIMLLGFAVMVLRIVGRGQDMRQGLVLGILCVIGIGFAGYAVMNFADVGAILMDFDRLQQAGSPDLDLRLKLHEATWEGFRNNLWLGTGAGSFQYRFPFLQVKYPELGFGEGLRFVHAHNDYLQVLMEYGLVGTMLLGSFFAVLVWGAIRSIPTRASMLVCFLGGIGAFALHAWWDFPGFCPSVLMLVVFLLAIMRRWGEAEWVKQRIDNI